MPPLLAEACGLQALYGAAPATCQKEPKQALTFSADCGCAVWEETVDVSAGCTYVRTDVEGCDVGRVSAWQFGFL